MSYSFLLKSGQANTVIVPVGAANNGQSVVLRRKSSTIDSTGVVNNGKATFDISADRVVEFAGDYSITNGGSVVQTGNIDVLQLVVPGGGSGGSVDLSNYPTKSQVSSTVLSAVSGKADLTYVNNQLANKASVADIAAKANSSDLKAVATSGNFADLSGTPDLSGFETVIANNTKLASKADAAGVYDKSQIDSKMATYTTTTNLNLALSSKANTADVYSKSQVDTSLGLKANVADVYTKTQADSNVAAKANVADVYTKTQSDSALAAKANTADFAAATDVVTTSGLTTSLAPYAKTADLGGVYLKITDYQDLVTRVSNLETAAGVTPSTRPTKPGTSAQPSFWLRGDQIAASGSTMSAWTDNVNNVTYAVPSGMNAPTYSATAVKGKPGAVFTKSATSRLYYPKSNKPENQTIFVVFSVAGINTAQGILQATDTAGASVNLAINTYLSSANNTVAAMTGNTGTNGFAGTTLSAAGAAIGRFTYGIGAGIGTNSAKTLSSSLNGGTIGSSQTQGFTAGSTAGFSLGGAGGGDINIAEVIIFDSELSSGDKVSWTQYLGTVYGITVGSN